MIDYTSYYELRGIAHGAGIDHNLVYMCNFVYEFFCHCSVIITKRDNEILHGRTLDYLMKEMLRDAIYNGYFIKDGVVHY